jgi:myo-inositol-1(or 4)-monophosphatase
LNQNEKFNAGFVTDADLASEAFLIKEIRNKFPGSSILAEESGENLDKNELKWIIDPLDGTTNFANGIPIYSISIAVEVEGVLKYGAIFNPATEELFFAEKDKGGFLNNQKMSIGSKKLLTKSIFSTNDFYTRNNLFQNSINSLFKVYSHCRVVRIPGSVALALAYTASGKYDGFWIECFNYWDIAAGILMVKEAGGVIVNYYQKPEESPKIKSFVASNKCLANQFSNLINTTD